MASSNPRSKYNYDKTTSKTTDVTSTPDTSGARPVWSREDILAADQAGGIKYNYNPVTGKYEKGGGSEEYKFDPATGTWVKGYKGFSEFLEESNNGTAKPETTSDGSNKSSSQVKSKEKAEKEFIEQEFNTLTGDLSVTPSSRSMKIRINETIKIEGIGRYLSGNYYVSSVSRTIDKDNGYSHTVTVLKNGFGDSLKKAYTSSDSNSTEEPRKEEVTKSSPNVEVGNTVKIVGDDAIYSNAHDGVKVPAWVKQKSLKVTQVSSDGARVLLQPINSWTYVKYIQKV